MFEAKHSFFKKIVRQTSCLHFEVYGQKTPVHDCIASVGIKDKKKQKHAVSVSKLSRVPLEVVNENIKDFFFPGIFPAETVAHLVNTAEFQGTSYATGMLLASLVLYVVGYLRS